MYPGQKAWFGHEWSRPHDIPLVEGVYRQACLRDCIADPKEFVVTDDFIRWARVEVIQGMRGWTREMDAEKFARGQLVDKFVWTYSLYMVAGYGEAGRKKWISMAVVQTSDWLRDAM